MSSSGVIGRGGCGDGCERLGALTSLAEGRGGLRVTAEGPFVDAVVRVTCGIIGQAVSGATYKLGGRSERSY